MTYMYYVYNYVYMSLYIHYVYKYNIYQNTIIKHQIYNT